MDIEVQLRGVARGDKKALAALFRELQPSFVRYATGLLAGDKGAAEDAVNEGFLAIWEQASRYNGSGSAQGWMRRIVRNKAVDWLRKQHESPMTADIENSYGETADRTTADPYETAAASSCGAQLRKALSTLNLEQREAIWLCYFEERSIREIAEIAGCPENTVKTRLFHGRRNLAASGILEPALSA